MSPNAEILSNFGDAYGVRKMYLDAFEASVESYSAEQEAALLAKQAHDKRTGFVVHR